MKAALARITASFLTDTLRMKSQQLPSSCILRKAFTLRGLECCSLSRAWFPRNSPTKLWFTSSQAPLQHSSA
eukprot:8811307-Prorocentrum_lima.AAC.1